MTIITSPQNSIIKHIKKLSASSYRKKCGEYILEGERLVRDAVLLNANVKLIVVSDDYTGEIPEEIPVYEVKSTLFESLKTTVNSQGIIAVAQMETHEFVPKTLENAHFAVYLDGVSDPGNVGTIIRTCAAAGVDLIILSHDCADIYNPKTIRSTMAGVFDVKIAILTENEDIFPKFAQNNFTVFATSLDANDYYYDADFTAKTVIILGSEANGIRCDVLTKSDNLIKIPMTDAAESLNVAVACGVLVFEAVRQKNLKKL